MSTQFLLLILGARIAVLHIFIFIFFVFLQKKKRKKEAASVMWSVRTSYDAEWWCPNASDFSIVWIGDSYGIIWK